MMGVTLTAPVLLTAMTLGSLVTGTVDCWQIGNTTYFNNGMFKGIVCVDVIDPKPVCGWRLEMSFYAPINSAPWVNNAILDFSSSTRDWFEYTNETLNGDLRRFTESCMNFTIQAYTTAYVTPGFDARMACGCYVIMVTN